MMNKHILDFVKESEDDDIEDRLDAMIGDDPEENDEQPKDDSLNIGLVSDTILYSKQDGDFIDRTESILDAFARILKYQDFQSISADKISSTLVFDIYVKHLMQQYKKNVNENAIYNVATENEIRRILANEFIVRLKGYNIS